MLLGCSLDWPRPFGLPQSSPNGISGVCHSSRFFFSRNTECSSIYTVFCFGLVMDGIVLVRGYSGVFCFVILFWGGFLFCFVLVDESLSFVG